VSRVATKQRGGARSTPSDQLRNAVGELAGTVGQRAARSVTDKVSSATKRFSDYAEGGSWKAAASGAKELAEGKSPVRAALSAGLSGVKDKVKGLFGGGGQGGKPKLTNIVESIDVGVPVELAYAQWTRFTEFPDFMKKVEQVEQREDEKLAWKAQIFWSHRSWDSTITEQVPNERIIWRSEGAKGSVDGAVTFHELAPQLTKIIVVLEYHPQGLFERTGNLWRAQGRRARLELKHFQRHVMAHAVLHADEIEGWPGEIHDGRVVDADEHDEHEDDDQEKDQEEAPRRRPSRARTRAGGRS
jgi:uncharacterized membrane protein